MNTHLGRPCLFNVSTSLPLFQSWLKASRRRLTNMCVFFHRPVALDLRMSMTLDMRGDRGSPTKTTWRMIVYFTDTGIGHVIIVVYRDWLRIWSFYSADANRQSYMQHAPLGWSGTSLILYQLPSYGDVYAAALRTNTLHVCGFDSVRTLFWGGRSPPTGRQPPRKFDQKDVSLLPVSL